MIALAGLLCLGLALPACQTLSEAPPYPPASAKPTPVPAPEPKPGITPPAAAPKPAGEKPSAATPRRPAPRPTSAASPAAPSAVDQYSVVVDADKLIRIPGPPGYLKVWIGSSANKPAARAQSALAEKRLSGNPGQAVKVTPFAPGILEQPKEGDCTELSPEGAEFQYELSPKNPGTYKVGADVALYTTPDCRDTPKRKAADLVAVSVEISVTNIVKNGSDDIAASTWKGFLDFWTQAVGLLFALMLFLLRKRLFEWFGFKGKED